MFDIVKKALLPVVAGVMTLGGAGMAGAQGVYLDFDGRDGPRIGIYDAGPSQSGQTYRRHDRDRWERDRWPRDRWDRDRRDRDGWDRPRRDCSPQRAVDKAERMGLRRARVVGVGRRSIDVMGRDRGERVIITFARAPNCPVIR
ncbi:MAG: hypothetical protein KF914_20560 [Rhizobiaceae bacterium]|nr:hypothetical protein [Rhizobiaceae bacterium]